MRTARSRHSFDAVFGYAALSLIAALVIGCLTGWPFAGNARLAVILSVTGCLCACAMGCLPQRVGGSRANLFRFTHKRGTAMVNVTIWGTISVAALLVVGVIFVESAKLASWLRGPNGDAA